MSIRIKENESATIFFRRFTFARTEAEGVGDVYSDQSLVNFASAGLGMSENSKYDTAVQLYNLERDGGKNYSLKDIEKKFFAIDEKTSREAAKTRIAQGNVAMGHRGEHNTHRPRNSRNPQRNGHWKTADTNAATDSNCHANTTCYNGGKKGHIVPNCPDKKNRKGNSYKPAQGNVAKSTSEEGNNSTALVSFARHAELPLVRPPRQIGTEPAVAMDIHARELCSTDIFVSLAVRVDESTFSWQRERSFQRRHLPELYTRDLEPIDEPLWVLLHNRPLFDLDGRFARFTRPDHRARGVFLHGIIPGI